MIARIVLLISLLLTIPAHAEDYYFDSTGGSDSNAGTSSVAPWQTVDRLNNLFQGANGVTPIACGDNVFLRRGRAWTANDTSDRILINGKHCTSANRIKIAAYDTGADPILDHSAITNTWAVRIQRSEFIEIDDLDVRGGIIGVAFEGVTDSHFKNGAVRNVQQQCIHIRRAATATAGTNSARITIEGNTIRHHNSTPSSELTNCGVSGASNGEGVYVGVDNLQLAGSADDNSGPFTIRNNEIGGTTHEGLEIKQGVTNPLIDGNYFHHIGPLSSGHPGAISIQGRGTGAIVRRNRIKIVLGTTGAEGMRLRGPTEAYRNIIDTCGAQGIRVTDPDSQDSIINIYNNTIYNCTNQGILIEGNLNAVHENNIGWSNQAGTNTATAYFNDAADPLLVDPTNGNYGLSASSPAIDDGTGCNETFNGSSCDRGAHETFIFSVGEVPAASATSLIITLTNNLFPPILPASACAGFTVEENTGGGFVSVTVSSCIRQGTNQILLTLATPISAESSVRFSYSTTTGNVTDSALIGNSLNQRLNGITNQAVDNNVEGGASVHVFRQVAFQFTRENNQIDTNTDIVLPPGSILLVKVQTNCEDDNCPPIGEQLRYSIGGGGYQAIPDSFDGNNLKFFGIVDSSPFIPAEGTVIDECLTGALTPVNGAIQRTSNAVPNVDLAQDNCVVNGYAIVFDTDADPAAIYRFRVYEQGGNEMNFYDLTGVATITGFPGVVATDRTAATGRAAATGRSAAGERSQVIQ